MSLRQVLTPSSTMRDIHDYCVQNNIHSLSQGMIEVRKLSRFVFLLCLAHDRWHFFVLPSQFRGALAR